MGLTMQKILDKFDNCDIFSLTCSLVEQNIYEGKKETELKKLLDNTYGVTEEEFRNAINKIEERDKEEKRKIYENNKEEFANYPEFNKLYEEIKKECSDFYCEANRSYYIRKHFKDEQLKNFGYSDKEINEMKKDFFQCGFIVDQVGKTTKYGGEHTGFFWNLYHDIAMNIDRQNNQKNYCTMNLQHPLEHLPNELKEHLLYYEISFFNSVTTSSRLMINYYFKLNQDSKKYLLQFRNDFCMKGLEDLTLYEDNKIKFSSCSHERFNSINCSYKSMNNKEVIDFINDEYFEENNNIVIETVNKLIKADSGAKFSFKAIGVNDKKTMHKICNICDKLNLVLVSYKKESPAILCNTDEIIEKK